MNTTDGVDTHKGITMDEGEQNVRVRAPSRSHHAGGGGAGGTLQPCDRMMTCPRSPLPSPSASWDTLQAPTTCSVQIMDGWIFKVGLQASCLLTPWSLPSVCLCVKGTRKCVQPRRKCGQVQKWRKRAAVLPAVSSARFVSFTCV